MTSHSFPTRRSSDLSLSPFTEDQRSRVVEELLRMIDETMAR
jgi:hypothetical protein